MPLFDDSRAAWGAAPNKSGSGTYVAPSRRIGVSWHYNGGSKRGLAARPHSACLTMVKAIQRMHQSGNGWQDIGYNLLVCPHGRAIEGRGADVVGAHSPGVNVTHYGVQTLTGGSEALTPAQIARMQQLDADLRSRSPLTREWGHRDDKAASTECPGDYIESLVKAGTFTRKPASTTPVATAQKDWFDMATSADLDKAISNKIPDIAKAVWLGSTADIITAPAANLKWDPENTKWTSGNYLYYTYDAVQDILASVTALSAAVKTLASSQGLDPAKVESIIKDSVSQALSGLRITSDGADA